MFIILFSCWRGFSVNGLLAVPSLSIDVHYKLQIRDINLLDLFVVSVHIRDGVLEANEDTACDADDEDQTEDDEGGHYN